MHTVLDILFSKIDDEPKSLLGKTQIGQKLSLENLVIGLNAFHFVNDFAIDQQIDHQSFSQQPTFVLNRHTNLPLDLHAAQLQFMTQSLFIDIFQQTRTSELAMHVNRRNNRTAQVAVRHCISPFLCVSASPRLCVNRSALTLLLISSNSPCTRLSTRSVHCSTRPLASRSFGTATGSPNRTTARREPRIPG